MSEPISKERRAKLWQKSDDGRGVGDHPDLHPLLRDYEAALVQSEADLEWMRDRSRVFFHEWGSCANVPANVDAQMCDGPECAYCTLRRLTPPLKADEG